MHSNRWVRDTVDMSNVRVHVAPNGHVNSVSRNRLREGVQVIHHKPVMVDKVVSALALRPNGTYIDCTVGEGGHSEAILRHCDPLPRLLGFDLDREALSVARERLSRLSDSVTLVESNYSEIVRVASEWGFLPCDGVLFDLGVSSLQLNSACRGFAFSQDGMLDMRFGPSIGRSAKEVVNETDERELADLLYRLGDEHRSRRIARAIVGERPIETTSQLAEVVARSVGRSRGRRWTKHPATRTFQALRIAVNDELQNVDAGIRAAITTLRPGGRLVIISYHSIEDRLAKRILQEAAKLAEDESSPTLRLVEKRVSKPDAAELGANPRSRSARMRVAERL